MSDESRWVVMNKTWGCWNKPSCWQSSNPPRCLQGHVFPDGSKDEAELWNAYTLLLFWCLCHFCPVSGHYVGDEALAVGWRPLVEPQ